METPDVERFKALQHPRHLPAHLRVCPGGPGCTIEGQASWRRFRELRLLLFSFFLLPLEKQVLLPLLIARWREQTQVSTTQSKYFITRRETSWRVGSVRQPLSPPFPSLGSGPGRRHLGGLLPVGDFMLQLWAQRWACYRCLWGGGLPGPDHGPLPVLRCW